MASKSGRRPNIILMLADQLRYDGLGCNGNPYADTPNLDRLARSGTVFHRHVTANPICMPSRASLLTGRYPNGHGVWHNGVPLARREYARFDERESGLAARAHEGPIISNVPTLPDTLTAAGYQTHAIGKLHLTPTGAVPDYGYQESRVRWTAGELDDWRGPYYGFDHVELTIGHGEQTIGHYGAWLRDHHPEAVRALADGRHRKQAPFPELPDLYPSAIPVEAHHSTWIGERARTFLEQDRDADRPFFLFLGFPDPHHPFTPPAELAEAFAGRDVLPPRRNDERSSVPEVVRQLRDGTIPNRTARNLSPECIRRVRQYTAAMVHLIDRAAGSVLATLDRLGLEEETIVIFTSDHGDFLGDHGMIRKETVCSDVLVHVPFLLRAPGATLPAETHAPMSNTDVLPTLCALANVPPPADVQGRSILPSLHDGAAHLVQVCGYLHEPRFHNFSLYDERYRFTWYPASNERELYDHQLDPHELRNRAGDPALLAEEERLFTTLLRHHVATDNPVGGRIARW